MSIDEEIRAISRGDQSAFSRLFRDQQRPMLAYSAALLAGDRQAAEDVVDEAFLDIWRSAASFDGRGNAQGWIRRIVRNKAIDWLRRQKSERTSEWSAAVENQADTAPDPEKMALAASDAHWLRAGLARLNFEQREAVILCYFEERPLAEISQIMASPENTIKTRLFHARKNLRHCLTSGSVKMSI